MYYSGCKGMACIRRMHINMRDPYRWEWQSQLPRKDTVSVRESDMPIVVKIDKTTKLNRSEGALLY